MVISNKILLSYGHFNITARRRVTVNQPVHGIWALATNICKSSARAPANQEHLWTVAKNRWQNQLLAVTYLRVFGESATQYRQKFWLKSHESSYWRTWSASWSSHAGQGLCQPRAPVAAEAQGDTTEMCFVTQPHLLLNTQIVSMTSLQTKTNWSQKKSLLSAIFSLWTADSPGLELDFKSLRKVTRKAS